MKRTLLERERERKKQKQNSQSSDLPGGGLSLNLNPLFCNETKQRRKIKSKESQKLF